MARRAKRTTKKAADEEVEEKQIQLEDVESEENVEEEDSEGEDLTQKKQSNDRCLYAVTLLPFVAKLCR